MSDRQKLQALARKLSPAVAQQRTRALGVIATVSPLTVFLNGGTTELPAHALNGYAPVLGDQVSIDNLEGDLLILGAFASGGIGPTPSDNTWQAVAFL